MPKTHALSTGRHVSEMNAFTVDAWLNPAVHGQNSDGINGLTVLSNTDTDGISLRIRNGFIQVDVRRNIGDFYFNHTFNAAPATPLPVNQWSHVAVTWDGATLKAYVNGVEIGSIPLVGGFIRTGSNAGTCPMIGNEPSGCNVQSGGFGFNGLIDELEFFNRALSQAEIQALVDADSLGKCKP